MTDDDRLYENPMHGRTFQDANVPRSLPIGWPYVIGNRPEYRLETAAALLSAGVVWTYGRREVPAAIAEASRTLGVLADLVDRWEAAGGVPPAWPAALDAALAAFDRAAGMIDDLEGRRMFHYASGEIQAADRYLRLWVDREAGA